MPYNYHTITFSEIKADLAAITREVESAFGALRLDQLNWKPSTAQWSVGQCLDHLIVSNNAFAPLFNEVIRKTKQTTTWERVPLVPNFFGWMLIKGLTSTQKFKAPPSALPAASAIDANIVSRFAGEQDALLKRLDSVSGFDLNKIIVTSPFLKAMTYSLLDLCRITAAHERRHFAQAQRVIQTSGFPQ